MKRSVLQFNHYPQQLSSFIFNCFPKVSLLINQDHYQNVYCVLCASVTDECTSSPCLQGGTCNQGVGWFTCDCVPGYVGDTCDCEYTRE